MNRKLESTNLLRRELNGCRNETGDVFEPHVFYINIDHIVFH